MNSQFHFIKEGWTWAKHVVFEWTLLTFDMCQSHCRLLVYLLKDMYLVVSQVSIFLLSQIQYVRNEFQHYDLDIFNQMKIFKVQ